MDWKLCILDPRTRKPKRGAFFRIALRLGVHSNTVRRWHEGRTLPTPQESRKLARLVLSPRLLAPKQRSDAGKKRGQYRKRAPRVTA